MESSFIKFRLILILAIIIFSQKVMINAQSDGDPTETDPLILITDTVLDLDGNLIIAGTTETGNVGLIKISKEGEIIWEDRFGGGSSSLDHIKRMLLDSDNNLVVAGMTENLDFPTSEKAFQRKHGGNLDLFLRKLDSDGNVVFSTLIGGSDKELFNPDHENGLLIDSNDNIIISGNSLSPDFEVSENAFQTLNKGGKSDFDQDYDGDVLLLKFSPDGSLQWSSFLGSSGGDNAEIKFDNSDNIVLSSRVTASDFETHNAYQTVYGGSSDGTITKFSADGEIIFSTYYGGDGFDGVVLTSIDSQDNIYAYTVTSSSELWNVDIPDQANPSGLDLFLTKLTPEGIPIWSQYKDMDTLGGSVPFDIDDDLVDDFYPDQYVINSEDEYILYTNTNTDQFVTKNAYRNETSDVLTDNIPDPVLLKFDINGNLNFSTYVGGSGIEIMGDLLLDSNDNMYLTGSTFSDDFLEKNNSFQTGLGGLDDIYIQKVSIEGELLWSTYLGGSDRERYRYAYFDNDENLIVIGQTLSDDFPLINPTQADFGGEEDIFVAKISSSGELLWSSYIGGEGVDHVNQKSILIDSDNQIYLISVTDSYDLIESGSKMKSGLFTYIQKFDATGNPIWNKSIANQFENPDDDSTTYLIVSIIIILSILGLLSGNILRLRQSKQMILNKNMSRILSPIFDSKPSLIYLFLGQSMIKDKDLEDDLKSEIPLEIFEFKEIFHPIRLSILKLLYENTKMTSIEIKEALDLSWNEINSNLGILQKKDYINIEQTFVESSMRLVITPEPKGLSQFQKLTELLEIFIKRTPNLKRYLDYVIEITEKGSGEEMYPSN